MSASSSYDSVKRDRSKGGELVETKMYWLPKWLTDSLRATAEQRDRPQRELVIEALSSYLGVKAPTNG